MTAYSRSGGAGVESAAADPPLAALLTPPGRGALAVVGVWGGDAAAVVDRLFAPRSGRALVARDDGAIVAGRWLATQEDVVCVRLSADRVEVHGHGGTAAPAAVLAGLAEAGVSAGRWHDWFAGGPLAREAFAALPAAWGPRAAGILSRQAAGVLDRCMEQLAGLVVRGERDAAETLGGRLLAAARVGLRLTEPWRVVLAGPVNAGKSSLANALLGHARCLVSPEPGTTRDVVATAAVIAGWAVEIVDSAGSRPSGTPLSAAERAGIERAAAARETADLVLRLVPADAPRPAPPPAAGELPVLAKADLLRGDPPAGMLATSAVTGLGIDALAAGIAARLVPEDHRDPSLLDGPVPFTAGQVAAIRRLLRGGG